MIALISAGPDSTQWYHQQAERLRSTSPCPVEVWGHEPRVQLPVHLLPTDEEIENIIEFQAWRLRTNVPFDPNLSLEQWTDFAVSNFSYYASAMEIAKEKRGLTHVVVSGSSRAGQRVITVAAQRLGLNVTCLEGAIFPRREGAGMTLSKARAHYEVPAEEFNRWREHELDEDRMADYRDWWLSERRTKHQEFVEDMDLSLPDDPIVWFQQVPGDAALYRWWVPNGAIDRISADLQAVDGFVKGHPRASWDHFPKFPEDRVIDRKTSIHDVFPRCRVAAVLSSAVGMEAWMYGLPSAVYGTPYYAQPELVNRSIPEALSEPKVDERERLRFLDYFIHEYTVLVGDAETALERIFQSEADWQATRAAPPREAPVRTDTASEDELEVPDTPVHLGGHLWHCHVDTGALSVLLESCGVESPTQAALVDVGCGTGGVVEAARRMGIHAYGIDGDPALPDRAKAWQNHPEWFLLHDFTHPLADLPTDWQGFRSCDESAFRIGWCVEFAEHVEERYIPNYVPVLVQCDVVILTAATSERGHHHVHLEPETYWRGVLAGHGCRLDPDLTEAVRRGSTMQREFIRDGAMVFRAVR